MSIKSFLSTDLSKRVKLLTHILFLSLLIFAIQLGFDADVYESNNCSQAVSISLFTGDHFHTYIDNAEQCLKTSNQQILVKSWYGINYGSKRK